MTKAESQCYRKNTIIHIVPNTMLTSVLAKIVIYVNKLAWKWSGSVYKITN